MTCCLYGPPRKGVWAGVSKRRTIYIIYIYIFAHVRVLTNDIDGMEWDGKGLLEVDG